MTSLHARQPMFNLPPMVKALAAVNILVFLVTFFSSQAAYELLTRYAFIPARYDSLSGIGYEAIVAPFTHLFLHGSFTHLAVNMAMLVAFGSGIEQRLGGPKMLVFYLLCGIAGALMHLLFNWGSAVPMIGASGAISGLFGGLVRLLERQGRKIILLVAVWLGFNMLSGLLFFPGEGTSIAWQAHMGGFLAGLLLFGLFDKGRRLA